ncbi:MAG: SRPBCC domain-containing protein [Ignavibacteriaceae bacterium]|nr:SRPBCC domain-containing protein [Ignavibacteriaceae bacterium]
MAEKKYDWTYFKRRIYIDNSSKQELFRKWATPKGLTEWFIEFANYTGTDRTLRKPDEIVKPGDKYHWTFHRGSKVEGEVLDVVEDNLFKFTFGKNDPDSEVNVIITVTFHEKNGKVWFDVFQDKMSDSNFGRVYYHISCNMGWIFHMNNMKSIITCGHDLRVKGVKRMHVDAPSAYPLKEYMWTQFKQKEFIKAPLKDVFLKWATPKGITEWYLKNAEYVSPDGKTRTGNEVVKSNDSYTWYFYSGLVIKGTVLEVMPNSKFKFTFGKKEPGSDEDVIVNVLFIEKDGVTEIELTQSNIADNEYGKVTYNLSCMVGWSYYLTNLRSLFESGFDYREKEEQLAKESTSYCLEE